MKTLATIRVQNGRFAETYEIQRDEIGEIFVQNAIDLSGAARSTLCTSTARRCARSHWRCWTRRTLMKPDINDCGMPKAWSEVYWPTPNHPPPEPRLPLWRRIWKWLKEN
jgi:hypothetical protein